jgi:hypothetical protein
MSFVNGTEEEPRESTQKREAYFLEYAREVRKAVKTPIMVTGGFRSRHAMEQAVTVDGIDMIGMARPTCVLPDAAAQLLSGATEKVGIEEGGLVIGRGRFGMNAQNWLINLVNTVSRVEYYAWQMTRMSRGQQPQTKARTNAIGYFVWYLSRTTLLGLGRKLSCWSGTVD